MRTTRLARMRPLNGLRQLHLIAHEHQILGRYADCDEVAEGNLAASSMKRVSNA